MNDSPSRLKDVPEPMNFDRAGHQDTGARVKSLYAPDGGARSIFSSKVADYVASRPDYPNALFDALATACGLTSGATVADIGAGTGLLTQGLLRKEYRVIAVEPNPEMRQVADHRLSGTNGYCSVDGCAEEMPLCPASVDLITAAQAFHWFEVDRARAEFLRVLMPLGQVALIWNDRVPEDPINEALDEMAAQFGGAKRAALVAHEKDRASVSRFFGATRPQEFSWPHAQLLEEERLLALVFSRSYIPGRNTSEGREVAKRVRELFNRFATNGTVEVRYQTIAIIGRPIS